MKKLIEALITIIICWGIVFAITFYTANKDIEFVERLTYSFIYSAFLSVPCLFTGVVKSKSPTKNQNATKNQYVTKTSTTKPLYVFNGGFDNTLICRVENNKIYLGMNSKPEYEIRNHKIYKILSNKWIYRIEKNRIYEGLDTKVKYKISSDKVYSGEFGNKPIFRIKTSRY